MAFEDYNEKRSHGSPDFPIEYYRVDENHPRYVMPLHWHGEFELIRVVSGRLTVYLDNLPYELGAGDILAVNCKVLHRGEPAKAKYECVVFDPKMLRKSGGDPLGDYLLPLISGEKVINCHYNREQDEIYRAVCELFGVLRENNSFYELHVYSLLFKILALFYEYGQISEVGKAQSVSNKAVQRLVEWIDEHFSEDITLKRLSEIAHMNEKYLCRVFRSYTGRTPIEYINHIRIEKSAEALLRGKTVTEAAFEHGFNELSYFSKIFRRYMGCSPRTYANLKQN